MVNKRDRLAWQVLFWVGRVKHILPLLTLPPLKETLSSSKILFTSQNVTRNIFSIFD